MIDFDRIEGPKASKQANFAQLVGEVLVRERNAFAIDGTGGDEGVDLFSLGADDSSTVFQVKYFLGRVGSSRRAQIARSLKTLLQRKHPQLWVLCTPVDPTPAELAWFQSLRAGSMTLEWWGETRLRSMISRHPDLVARFFTERLIVSELRLIREELRSYRRPSAFQRDRPERLYLREAAETAALLRRDRPLAAGNGLMAIDFSEIYTYMETDGALALGRPLVEYCFDMSPVRLALPPGAAVHLKRFTESIRLHQDRWSSPSAMGRELLPVLRDDFVRSYETDPNSSDTERAFLNLLKHLPPGAQIPAYGLNRLGHLLKNRRIVPWTLGAATEGELFGRIHRHFSTLRPGRAFSNFASALDMTAVVEADRIYCGNVRMLSSVASVQRIASNLWSRGSPIRSSRQLGQLIYIVDLGRKGDAEPESWYSGRVEELAEAVAKMKRALPAMEDLLQGGRLSKHLAKVLTDFASAYRTLLRPLDCMVEGSAQALRKRALASMSDLYRSLRSQAELSAAFRAWWENVCEAASELESYVSEHYDTEKLIAAAQELAGQSGDHPTLLSTSALRDATIPPPPRRKRA